MAKGAGGDPTEVRQRDRGVAPLVSVVVPAYNCAPFIGETVSSVYQQTYRNWEVIVIDDGSTDETKGALAPHMGRIRYVHQQNRGTAAARNEGVRHARGELIAFLDHDDVWLPEKLDFQVRVMGKSSDCGLVFTDGKMFTADGIRRESALSGRLDQWIDAHPTEDLFVVAGNILRNLLFCNEIVSASSVMVRRECLERVGGFDEGIAIADDHDLWLRIARQYTVALIRRCLYMWRWHDGSQSGPIRDRMQGWTEASLVVQEKHLPHAPPDVRRPLRAQMAKQYWECARFYFDRNQFRQSRKMLIGCIRHDKIFLPAMAFFIAAHLNPSIVEGLRRLKRGMGMRRRVAGR